MELQAVCVDRNMLIGHENWSQALQSLLLELYKYDTAVVDISASWRPEIPIENCLFLVDCEDTLRQARDLGAAVLGIVPPQAECNHGAGEGEASWHDSLPIIVEGFEEVDFYFLERIYQRHHNIPWTVIETERCVLREIALEDLDDLFELYRPPEITRYMTGLFATRSEEEEYMKKYIDYMYRFYGYGMWVVIERETGKLIGRAGIDHLEVEGQVQLELGYVIAVSRQNQGYATEVCHGILEYARNALSFDSIHCLIQKENAVSIHLAEKLGFCLDKTVLCNGQEMQRYSKPLHF